MRKSNAPSLKTKITLQSKECPKSFSESCNSVFENTFGIKRSTESILTLLSNFDSLSPEDPLEIQQSETKNEEYSNQNIADLKTEEINLNIISENKSSQVCKNENGNIVAFNVVYGKQTKKKHKTWEGDGVVEVGAKYLTLRDENGCIIGKAPCSKARKLEEGVRFYIGNKEVELLNRTEGSFHKLPKQLNEQERKEICLISCKEKSELYGKKFKSPRSCYESGMALPNPTSEHQWKFNQAGLPVTPVFVEEVLSKKLRKHQCDGIKFLYESIMGFKDINYMGAILADEMGLGKTLQCIALIWTLLKQGPYGKQPVLKKVLIVTPSSLIMNWHNEFIKWLGRAKLVPFVITQKNKSPSMREQVLIISYEMLVRCVEDIEQYKFDLIVCDEGHRLKNSNIKTAQTLNRLNCLKKIILTGTPIQNDLQELYTLADFVNPNILGTPSQFRSLYAGPIIASRQPDSPEGVVKKGEECSFSLKKIMNKFLLRRTRDILKNYLPPRHDAVIFCKITDTQKKLYNSLINSFLNVKENNFDFLEGSSHLELITLLKKVCSHPSLLDKVDSEEVPAIDISGKIMVTINFLQELQMTSPKEKAVVVSNFTQTLDLLEKIFQTYQFSTCRLDGSTPTAERNKIVEKFNNSFKSNFIFLLSSKAGGVGLNVTGASRLILFDSDWNPATDLQAISRIWRDGQKFPVYIYRLLTAGTIEEKIYQRQLSKQGLCEGTVDPQNNKSIKLSKEELKDLFVLCENDLEDCMTHNILSCDCSKGGEIPAPFVEEEERNGQLLKVSNSALKICELFQWEHHGRPFSANLLNSMCLSSSEKQITFIFHNCKI